MLDVDGYKERFSMKITHTGTRYEDYTHRCQVRRSHTGTRYEYLSAVRTAAAVVYSRYPDRTSARKG